MAPRSILVVSACSATKRRRVQDPPTFDDLVDPARRAAAEARLAAARLPAVELYGGAHHLSVVADARRLRRALPEARVDLAIVSAGYGVLGADDPVVPYEATFADLPKAEIARRAAALGLGPALRRAVGAHDAAVFLLGEDYLTAVGAPLGAAPCEVYFAPARPPLGGPGVVPLPAGFPEARRVGTSPRMVKAVLFGWFVDLVAAAGWDEALARARAGELLLAREAGGGVRQLPLATA